MSEKFAVHFLERVREKQKELFDKVKGVLQGKRPQSQTRPKIRLRPHWTDEVRMPSERLRVIVRPPVEPQPRIRIRIPEAETTERAIIPVPEPKAPERSAAVETLLKTYFDRVANNIALDLKGTSEGTGSRLNDGEIAGILQEYDIVFPTLYVPNEGHWGGVVLALNETDSQALVIDSLMRQSADAHITVNGKDHLVTRGNLVRTIQLTDAHFMVFNAMKDSQMMQKQIQGRAGTALPTSHIAIAADLNKGGYSLQPSLIGDGEENRQVRESYNRSYYGNDVDLAEMLPFFARIPTQRDSHKCGEHSIIVIAMAQMALQAIFIDKVRTKQKRFEGYDGQAKIAEQSAAIAIYKGRIAKAEDLLLKYSPAVFRQSLPVWKLAMERLKIRTLVMNLFPSEGVRNGLSEQ